MDVNRRAEDIWASGTRRYARKHCVMNAVTDVATAVKGMAQLTSKSTALPSTPMADGGGNSQAKLATFP